MCSKAVVGKIQLILSVASISCSVYFSKMNKKNPFLTPPAPIHSQNVYISFMLKDKLAIFKIAIKFMWHEFSMCCWVTAH